MLRLAGRRLEADAVGGAAADHEDGAGLGRGAAAVAEGVAALDGCTSSTVAVTLSASRSPSQRSVPMRGRIVKSGVRASQRRRARRRSRWLTQIVVGAGSPAADHVGHQPLDLGEVGARAQRQVEGHPLEPRRCGARGRAGAGLAQLAGADMPWRSIVVSRSSTNRALGSWVEQRLEVARAG